MGSWLKSLWSRWWIHALVAIVFVGIFCAVWIGGGELGAAVGAAVAASLSAVATFLVWQVMKAQTVIFREQTEVMRPGCRVHLTLHGVPGMQESLIGYYGDGNGSIGMACTVVPKPGSRVIAMAGLLELLGSNDMLLHQMMGEAVTPGTGERMWSPAEPLEEHGTAAYIIVPTETFKSEIERLIPQGLARVRIAVMNNYGTDVSESTPVPSLDKLGPLILSPRSTPDSP